VPCIQNCESNFSETVEEILLLELMRWVEVAFLRCEWNGRGRVFSTLV
jgi:hypothetical protein